MEPTLQICDHIIVNKKSYGIRLPLKIETLFDFREPKRGDVVVFTLPEDSGTNIIKRVIGLPGDVVQVRIQP
ncbi:MAG: signal peptidase I [Bacteroidota bacterium]